MTSTAPTIGAAMPSAYLDDHLDWLLSDQRDLEIQDFARHTTLDDEAERRTRIDTIKSRLNGYSGRMGLHGPFWNLPLAAFDPKIRAIVVDRHREVLDVCAELGASHMVVHSPLEFLGAPDSLTRPQMANRDLFEVIHETMDAIVRHAESINCMLVIENTFDKHPTLLTALVESFKSACVRQSLDVGHAYINYCEGAPPPDYWVRTAGALLEHLHLQDTDGYTDRHWSVGEGRLEWEALFMALGELEHQPRLLLELRDPTKIQTAAALLTERGLVR